MVYAFWVLNMGSVTSVLFVNGVIPVFLFVLLFNGMERLFGGAVPLRGKQTQTDPVVSVESPVE